MVHYNAVTNSWDPHLIAPATAMLLHHAPRTIAGWLPGQRSVDLSAPVAHGSVLLAGNEYVHVATSETLEPADAHFFFIVVVTFIVKTHPFSRL